jgi:ADP-heptose:LPS heptosyltransferase
MKSNLLYWYLKFKNIPPTTPIQTWKKCLITSEHHIGDVLYRTASLDILKRGLPNCSLYYLCSKDSLPILANNPYIEKALPFLENVNGFRIKKQFVKQLKDMRFDAILITDIYKYYRALKLSLHLNIPNRVCFGHKGFTDWMTHPIYVEMLQPWPYYIRQYYSILTNLKVEGELYPKVYLTDEDNDLFIQFRQKYSLSENEKIIAIFLRGKTQRIFYPYNKIVDLIKLIKRNDRTIKIFILGSNTEKENVPLFRKINIEQVIYSFGELSIRELLVFLRKCTIVYTPDSGPRHLANAVRTPVIFYRHMMQSKIKTGKYCSNETDIFESNRNEYLSAKECKKMYDSIEPATIYDLMKRYL